MFDKAEYMRDYNKRYYQERKQTRIREVLDKYEDFKDTLARYKVEQGCARCGYNKSPRALHFHHLDPSAKVKGIAEFRSMESALEEIEKCELLCANCHAEEHDNWSG